MSKPGSVFQLEQQIVKLKETTVPKKKVEELCDAANELIDYLWGLAPLTEEQEEKMQEMNDKLLSIAEELGLEEKP